LGRPYPESADGSLSALVVAVQDVDCDNQALRERLFEAWAEWVVLIPDGALPVAGVAGCDVEVALLEPEVRRVRVLLARHQASRRDVPAVEHREPGAHVAQRDRHVVAAVRLLQVRATAAHGEPPLDERDPLWRVLGPRRDEDRPQAHQKRLLGYARGAVRRTHG